MKEAIMVIVVGEDDHEHELQIVFEDDCLEFVMDGKELFSGDWSANFSIAFERAIDLWEIIMENRA